MDTYAVGIDIGGTNLRGAVVNKKGEFLNRYTLFSQANKGIEHLLNNLLIVIEKLTIHQEISGIGIGVPGIIDTRNGILTQAPNIKNVSNYPILKELNKRIKSGRKLFIENDANCAALGEYTFGSGKNVESLIMITLGTGVGGGIILNGNIWSGADGMGGEIGHMKIYPGGYKCKCGGRGCLESYSSLGGIKNYIKDGIKNNKINTKLLDKINSTQEEYYPELFFKEAKSGNRFSRNLWNEFGKSLGIGIANLTNLLNVEMVVIGGGIANAWGMFINYAKQSAKENTLIAPYKNLKIVRSRLKGDAGILGAASLVMNVD